MPTRTVALESRRAVEDPGVAQSTVYGVVTILAGWCILWHSRTFVIYTVLVLCAVHVRVLLAEEPWAARRFGMR